MRQWAAFACATVLALCTVAVAHATAQVEVLGTYPAGGTVTLHRHQEFYLHLHYTSDQPVHIWSEPYFEGKPANAGSNPSRAYPAGSGEALGWFFLGPGERVDEVRISAGDGSVKGTRVVATYPVSVAGGDGPAQASAAPAWVGALRAADEAAQRADDERVRNTPTSAGDIALLGGFMVAMVLLALTGAGGPAWGLWRWRGGWRIAAAVPAVLMAAVVLNILIGTARDPTSHNLWPFEIVIWGGFSCLWMLVAGLARRLSGAGRGPS